MAKILVCTWFMNLKWNVNWINFFFLFPYRICEMAQRRRRPNMPLLLLLISYANLVNNNQRDLAWPTSPIHEQDVMQWISSVHSTLEKSGSWESQSWCCAARLSRYYQTESIRDQADRLCGSVKKSTRTKVQINYTSHDTVNHVTCEKGLKFFSLFSNQWEKRREEKKREVEMKLNA